MTVAWSIFVATEADSETMIQPHFVIRACRRWLVIPVLLLSSGCNWFEPLALILPEPKKTVPAEFAHLKGSVTVVVWVHPETLYDYPHLRLELAGHVADRIAARVRPAVTCADIRDVEQYLDRLGTRFVEPVAVGRHFGTRFVIYLEVLEFAMRDSQVPDLLQGRIRAAVVVHDLSGDEVRATAYELAPVSVAVPSRPTRFTQANAARIRKATYETFAGVVAKKFYDHREVDR